MRIQKLISSVASTVLLLAASPSWAEEAKTLVSLREKLDTKVAGLKDAAVKSANEQAIADAIKDFYSRRDFRPIWFDDAGLSARGKALMAVLANAGEHGLNPAAYGMPKLAERAAKADAKSRAEIELAVTRAYLDYAGDVSSGAVDNPRKVGGTFRDPKRPGVQKLLADAVAAPDAAKYFASLPPDTRRYNQLKTALAKYREIEKKGGWPTVAAGPTLKPGMAQARVVQVRKRLAVTGDLKYAGGKPDLYDDALAAAVKKFQARHGLKDDGSIGNDTVAAMNVSVKDRVEQLVINLERRRWLAGYLGDRYIYVNIADNELKIVEKDKTVYEARVVVGKPYHETPVFSGSMSYIELNPWWNVPHSIATKEMLPTIKKSPGYLAANDYLLLTRQGDNSSAIDASSVDWSEVTPASFPYHIRQKPGPKNALGTTLFMFPNVHNVFIHDTPARSYFNLEDRFFSHGCVRVENPMKLALFLLKRQGDDAMNEARYRAVVEKKEPFRIDFKNPIAVHITYLTAWADNDGTVHFRRDAYNRDSALRRAVAQIAQVR
jgi:murein L,D-transpeptidase YcbB/YkuD